MRLRSLSALAAFAVLAALMLAVSAASGAATGSSKKTYIVQMLERPVVAYEGGVAGIPATKPAKGKKLDKDAPEVQEYVSHLKGKHDKALAKVGGKKVYDYAITFNGFAAELTKGQAEALKKVENVLAVTEDEIRKPDTATTPDFLGLTKKGGLWDQLGGPANAGEDIIIGIVDTGIWPEHPSFADKAPKNDKDNKDAYKYKKLKKGDYAGTCDDGEEFSGKKDCNDKLVGAQYFYAGFGVDQIADRDYLSPRDYNGHGSHTAGTAGGNHGVPATGDAAAFGKVSGMAPRARIAAYKVCWEDAGDGGCASSDSMAAIDKAVADGVDVINFSISGTRTNFLDPVEVAFLFAADAGVFVAASAGNTNGAGTVAHPSPWITTVAASTHDRGGVGSVTFGNAATFTGASVAPMSVSGSIVDSETAPAAGATSDDARLCYPGSLDASKVSGKIVLCDRGAIARTDKSFAVKEAGGIGMVMTNTSPIGTNADLHYVPSIHLESTDRAAVKAYVATAGATATIAKGQITTVPAPFMAGFSSDGPLRAGGGDLLKPDVTAPGVDVLAAVAPPGNRGREFDLYSGTSMSSPHVAGLGAALKDLHPGWSPMMVKSALMSTGYDLPTATAPSAFEYGGGHVDPTKAADPGLVFDSGFGDWLAFLKGQKLCCASSASIPALDASDLNLASIAIGDMVGSQTVTRTATSVGDKSESYTFSVEGLTGIAVTPSVTSFTAAPGSATQFSVTFQRTTAPIGAYQGGSIKWTGSKGHVVRMPVVIRPLRLSAPAEVAGNASGATWKAKVGYTGTLNATVRGLVPATTTAVTVAQDPDSTFDPADPTGTYSKNVTVPHLSTLRAGIYEDAITPAGTDLDLFVYDGSDLVGLSADGDSNEEVTLRNTSGGPITYTVYVHGWSTGGAPSADLTLFDWVLGTSAAGNAAVSPASTPVNAGDSVTYSATFSGLAASTRYLGAVEYNDGTSLIGRTYLAIRTP